jgi:hypothetical protein
VTALGASCAGEAMRENPAFEIAAELAFDMGWAGSALAAIAGEFEPGGEVRLHGAIEHGTFGPATAIDGSASRGTGGRHGGYESGNREATTVRPYSCGLNACWLRDARPSHGRNPLPPSLLKDKGQEIP